ncbi:MAG: hypothetical protein WCV85_05340 [Patescibacteria group bacterium]|jgi:hypothetical protein
MYHGVPISFGEGLALIGMIVGAIAITIGGLFVGEDGWLEWDSKLATKVPSTAATLLVVGFIIFGASIWYLFSIYQ